MKAQKPRTYVIKFGLHPPVVHGEEVLQQLKAGHKYRNYLVEVERKHRELVRKEEAAFGLDVLEAEKARLKKEAEEAKGAQKKAIDAKMADVADRIWEIRNGMDFLKRMHEIDNRKMEPLGKGEKREKKSMAEERNKTKETNNSIIGKLRRDVRARIIREDNLFWGSYLVVERAAMASSSSAKGDGPRFTAWEGTGQIGIQIQKGKGKKPIKGSDLFAGTDKRCSISGRPASWAKAHDPRDTVSIHEAAYARESLSMQIRRDALRNGSGAQKRHAGRVRLSMEICSVSVTKSVTSKRGKTREVITKVPIVAEWPMIMHKDIPDDVDINWIVVSRRRVGPSYVWSCEITVSEPVVVDEQQPREVAAVVFGWRKRGSLVRVAQWLSASGDGGALELLDLPVEKDRVLGLTSKGMRLANLKKKDVDGGWGGIIDGIRVVRYLTAIRDEKFNDVCGLFVQWLESQPAIPTWMASKTTKKRNRIPTKKQATAYVRIWAEKGAKRRLVSMINTWKHNRFEGDEEIFAQLEAWRFKDHHLWKWERRQDTSARRRRTATYRNFAAQITDRFGMLLVDGTNFKSLQDKEPEEKLPGRKPKSMAQMVAPGELRLAISQAAVRKGRVYEKPAPARSAQRCPSCGKVHRAHRDPDEGMFACSHCTFEDHIMHTRLLNMLRDAGHETAVQRIIANMERAKNKLRHNDDHQPQPEL